MDWENLCKRIMLRKLRYRSIDSLSSLTVGHSFNWTLSHQANSTQESLDWFRFIQLKLFRIRARCSLTSTIWRESIYSTWRILRLLFVDWNEKRKKMNGKWKLSSRGWYDDRLVLIAKFSRLLPEATVNIPVAIIFNRFTLSHVEYSPLTF